MFYIQQKEFQNLPLYILFASSAFQEQISIAGFMLAKQYKYKSRDIL